MPTWSDINPATADFTKENMLIPYKGGISKQFLQKLANNTGYNFAWGPGLIIDNASFTVLNQFKTFDANHDYRNVYMVFWMAVSTNSPGAASAGWDLDPADGTGNFNYHLYVVQVTTSYQTFPTNTAAVPPFDYAAEANGNGLNLRCNVDPSPGTQYIWGILWRIDAALVDSGT